MKKYVLEIGNKEYTSEVKEITAEYAKIDVNGTQYHVKLKELGRFERPVSVIQSVRRVEPTVAPAAPKPAPSVAAAAASAGIPGDGTESVKAPLPGLILDVKVKEGDAVKAGQDLLIMEAMKMENVVQAPHDGTVTKVYVKKSDSISEGDVLVTVSRSFISTL